MNMTINEGDFIKCRFWPGERIWARVTSIEGDSVMATLENNSAVTDSQYGDVVTCLASDILETMEAGPQ